VTTKSDKIAFEGKGLPFRMKGQRSASLSLPMTSIRPLRATVLIKEGRAHIVRRRYDVSQHIPLVPKTSYVSLLIERPAVPFSRLAACDRNQMSASIPCSLEHFNPHPAQSDSKGLNSRAAPLLLKWFYGKKTLNCGSTFFARIGKALAKAAAAPQSGENGFQRRGDPAPHPPEFPGALDREAEARLPSQSPC